MNQRRSAVHPTFKPRMHPLWWLHNWRYFLFMMRELSAVFVAFFVLTYLVGVYRLGQGEDSYQLYVNALQTPMARTLFIMIFLFSIYHSVTWVHLTPIILVVRIGRKVVPPGLVLLANYLGWILISAVLFYLLVVT
ncbi:MAG: fumarate reductase subunit C [Acidobacteriota bacterium]|nr:fumarate reductase subunit C [Acidobacteriota bacterium]